MARLQIHVSHDGLTATVAVGPGAAATSDELFATVAAAGVTHGLDADALAALATLLADPTASGRFAVATGTAPIDGRDGALEGDAFAGPRPGARRSGDRVDFRERSALHPVACGARVARIVPPASGEPGRDVRGRELACAPGAPFAQRLGDGVRREGDDVVATRAGVVLATDELVDVVALYEHDGDVDYGSGNLHTAGSLSIDGDVGDGFTACAGGDVVVTGNVQGGAEAGGSVFVARAILGDDLAVRADVDIECRLATSARLRAGRAIVVHDQVSQSDLRAPRVFVREGHGSVRGGAVRARDEIEVSHAGAPTGVATVLAAGQLLDERQELARRTAATERHRRSAMRAGTTGSERAAVRAGDRERDERLRLRRRQRETMRGAVVRVLAVCHPGVVVQIGGCRTQLEEPLRGVEFRYDDATASIFTRRL